MRGLDDLALPDGRRLEARVSGPDDGTVLVFHHGTPGVATPFRAIERAAHARGLRLVTTSRPGYGRSTRQWGRAVADVVPDTDAVLDALGVEDCLVAGWSGGGPHALACAAGLSRARAVLVIAGVAPHNAEDLDWMGGMGDENVTEFGAALEGEESLRSYLGAVREHLKDISATDITTALASILPDVDKAALSAEFGEDMATTFRKAVGPGVDGWLDDDLAFTRSWGFELDEVNVPTSIWQGSLDLMVPFSHGEWLAEHVPGASVHLLTGEGHISVAVGALDEMVDELIDAGGLKP